MVYADITYIEDENWKGYYMTFHWNSSSEETAFWNARIRSYFDNTLWKDMYFDGKYLRFSGTILDYLAERNFIPWGDNIFYKKWFLG